MGATILFLVLISDYGLTLCGARLYRRIATRMAVEGSYESIPLFEADIDAGRLVSWRFIVALIVMVGALGLAARLGASFGIDEPLYLFLAGFLIFIEVPVHVQHLSNIARFSLLMHPDAAQGQIVYARWFALRAASVNYFIFTGLFLLTYAGTASPLFLGGALRCVMVGILQVILSLRAGRHRVSRSI